MSQTIYCNCFYCKHHEDDKCLAPVLHLGFHDSCREFALSEEKLNTYLDAIDPDFHPDKEYGAYDLPNTAIRIRQK